MEEEQSMHRLKILKERHFICQQMVEEKGLEQLCEISETLYKLRVLCDQCDGLTDVQDRNRYVVMRENCIPYLLE